MVVWALGDGVLHAVREAVGAAHEVAALPTLEAARERIARGGAPAVIVIGGRAALEACASLRQTSGPLVSPVVLLVEGREEIAAAFAWGASDVVARPWSHAELAARIEAQARLAGAHAAALAAERERVERARAVLARLGDALFTPLDSVVRIDSVAQVLVPELADLCIVYVKEAEGLRMAGVGAAERRWAELAEARAALHPVLRDSPRGSAVAARTGRPELVPVVTDAYLDGVFQSDEDRALFRALAPRSMMTVPLLARGRVVGALTFVRVAQTPRYGPADVALAEEIATRAGVAIENARLFEEAAAERRRAEEASRLKDEFLAVVSHELRTPLTAILGWSRMLLDAPLPEAKRARALAAIERNARAQTRLIEDLLDVSRIISGTLRVEVAPVELFLVVETAIEAVRPTADAKGVKLRAQLDDVGAALGDADRVRQIVENLLTNAVKFTPAGGLVRVSLERDRGAAKITVVDTGQGIAPEFLPHVFERFRQADAGTTRAHGGLGIGLTIAKRIVELHGGTIEAQSEGAGRGAAFVVRLPLLAPHAERSASPARGFTMALPDLGGLRVLIVDDEADMRALLTAALELCHAEPSAAGSAAEALAELLEAPPDVLISDIGMAGDDGYALIRKVRALPEGAGGRVPAVALTAYARDSDRQAALGAGFDRHLAKPIDPMELLAAVAQLARR